MVAENATGLRNLFKLSSLASIEGQLGKWARMDADVIAQYAEGIIATTGCPSGEVQTRLRLGHDREALEAAAKWQEIFGKENFYLELMEHGLEIERRVRDGLLDIGRKLGIKLIVTNDCHYVTKEHAAAHEALLCVQTGKTLSDPTRFKFDGDGYYLKSAAEMREQWDSVVPGACDNTLEIGERVESYKDVFTHRDRMPVFPVPDGETQQTFLRKEVAKGLQERRFAGTEVPQEYLDRANYELDVIIQMGFPAYFLVVGDLIRHALEVGIRVGPGRGSAAGSLVAWALGITNIDPIPHGLLFERFLNPPERVSMPDIDIDFDDRRRGEMVRYATERWGSDKVAQVITFGTIKTKAAIKDSARVQFGQRGVRDRRPHHQGAAAAHHGQGHPGLGGHHQPRTRALRRGRRGPHAHRDRPGRQEDLRHRARPRGPDPQCGRARLCGDHVLGAADRRDPGVEARPGRRDHHRLGLPVV